MTNKSQEFIMDEPILDVAIGGYKVRKYDNKCPNTKAFVGHIDRVVFENNRNVEFKMDIMSIRNKTTAKTLVLAKNNVGIPLVFRLPIKLELIHFAEGKFNEFVFTVRILERKTGAIREIKDSWFLKFEPCVFEQKMDVKNPASGDYFDNSKIEIKDNVVSFVPKN